jgi:hypothetical protein
MQVLLKSPFLSPLMLFSHHTFVVVVVLQQQQQQQQQQAGLRLRNHFFTKGCTLNGGF